MSKSSQKKKITNDTEESLQMEEVLEFKSKKRPFNPYKMRGVVIPSSWLMLDRCQCFHRVFTKEDIENFRNKLDKEFLNMMKGSYRVTTQCSLHKNVLQQSIGTDQDETFSLVEKAIRKATEHALKNEPPPQMSPTTRAISLNILELLATLYSIDIPTRRSTNKHSQLLIYISDWTAKIFANVYSQYSSMNDDSNYSLYSPSSKLSVADEEDIGSLDSFDASSKDIPSIEEFAKERILELIKIDEKLSPSSLEESAKLDGGSLSFEEKHNLKSKEETKKNNQVIEETLDDSVTDLILVRNLIRSNKTGCPPLTLNQCLHEPEEASSSVTRCKKIKDKKGCLKKDGVKIYTNNKIKRIK